MVKSDEKFSHIFIHPKKNGMWHIDKAILSQEHGKIQVCDTFKAVELMLGEDVMQSLPRRLYFRKDLAGR